MENDPRYMLDDEWRRLADEEHRKWQADQLERSKALDLSTDEGFSEFCSIRWIDLSVHPESDLWRPKRHVTSNGISSFPGEQWLPIDDVLDSLMKSTRPPRIDLSDPKWRHWRFSAGPFLCFRRWIELERTKGLLVPESHRQLLTKISISYAETLWKLERQIIDTLDQSHPEWFRVGYHGFRPYYVQYSERQWDRRGRSRFTPEPEWRDWPRDEDRNSLWDPPDVHEVRLAERTFLRHLENLEAALKSARHLRKMAEQRSQEINASPAVKPNFGKRRMVGVLAEIWSMLTGSEPSSAPDSRFSEFVYASWNSIVNDPPELSFDIAIREVVKAKKISRSME